MSRVGAPPAEFATALAAQRIELDPGDVDALATHLDMLLEANERFNLTAIREPAQAWMRHAADSLSLLPWLADAQLAVDLGSGGGFPGMPLAIALPGLQVHLVESVGKKCNFLREVAARLGLANVTVHQRRAEEMAAFRGGMREQADAVVCRAVGSLATLVELAVPLLKVEGLLLAIKGERAPDEIREATRALHELHAEVVDSQRTPTGTVVVIRKLARTVRLYPRDQGLPARKPLGAPPREPS